MPLFNWIQCNDGNFQFVRVEANTDQEPTQKDGENWIKIYDQYLKKYGLGKMYERLLKVMKKKALLECDFVITGEKFKLTQIEVEEANLKSMLANAGNGMTIEQSLVHLSRWLGYQLNTKKITVAEYFNILNQYGKENTKK
jgi:hypothetical protein